MAPKRKRTDDTNSPSPSTTRVTRSSGLLAGRVTRSSTLSGKNPPPIIPKNQPRAAKRYKKTTKTRETTPAEPTDAPAEPTDAPTEPTDAPTEPTDAPAEPTDVVNGSKTVVVIEHCKQCSSFKTRANQVKIGLEKDVEGVNVLVNPKKPRKGCFEIRVEGSGETFVSLLDMKRPFQPMKDLDMEKLISEIVAKINK